MDFKKLLAEKRLIVVCGLGGVGKTSLSAALALRAAMKGKKCLVITVDPAKRLAQALNLKGPSPDPKKIWGEPGQGELHACLLDAKETFDKLIKTHASKEIQELILGNKLYQQLSMMLAGTQEYMAMEKLYSLSQTDQFDLIVVDTPPARHAIDFLKAPLKMTQMLNDSLLKLLIAPSLKMGEWGTKMLRILGRVTGGSIFEDISELMTISLQLLNGFALRAEEIQKHLKSRQTAFVLATTAHTGLISDALPFRKELSRLKYRLEGVIINRMPLTQYKDKEFQKAMHWVRSQKDPLWRKWGEVLSQEVAKRKKIERQLKPVTQLAAYVTTIPDFAKGVSNLTDLNKMAQAF